MFIHKNTNKQVGVQFNYIIVHVYSLFFYSDIAPTFHTFYAIGILKKIEGPWKILKKKTIWILSSKLSSGPILNLLTHKFIHALISSFTHSLIPFGEPHLSVFISSQLSPAERDKKERRREQNRRAAQRCRSKKRHNQNSVLQVSTQTCFDTRIYFMELIAKWLESSPHKPNHHRWVWSLDTGSGTELFHRNQ